MDTIDKQILEEIKTRLLKIYNPKIIYLFGSFAWGVPNKNSDFDIAVIVDQSNEKPYKRVQRGLIGLWDMKQAIDLLVYTSKEFDLRADHPATLQHNIGKNGIKIYEAA
mgnify:CR=1 FL=1